MGLIVEKEYQMKKLLVLFAFLAFGFTAVPQAQAYEPWGLSIYDGTKEVMQYAAPGATLGSKTGSATCHTVLGIVNWGDCSLRTAMKNGRISKVTAADWGKKYIVVYGHKTLYVYGN